MFDPWSLMGVFLYVMAGQFPSLYAHITPLDLSRRSTAYSGSCGYLRVNAPFRPRESSYHCPGYYRVIDGL